MKREKERKKKKTPKPGKWYYTLIEETNGLMKREQEKDGLMKTDLVMTFSCGKMKRRVETTKSRVLGETRVAIEQHLGLHKITIPGGGYQPLSGRRASKRISHLSRIISELLLSVYHSLSLSLNLSNGNLPPTLYSLCNTMIFPSDWKKVGTRKKERKKKRKKEKSGGREREKKVYQNYVKGGKLGQRSLNKFQQEEEDEEEEQQ